MIETNVELETSYLVFPFVLVVIKVVDPGIVLPEHNDNAPKIMPLSG